MNSSITSQTLRDMIARYAPALVLYARQIDAFSAEDVVQEAFVRLVEVEEVPENVKGWLFRVVRNGAISARRALLTRCKHERRLGISGSGWFELDHDSRLDAAHAVQTLAELPTELREVVVARVWGELTFEEIGELTQTSRSSAHRRYVEGLATMRDRLEKPCPGQKIECQKSEYQKSEPDKSETIN